MAFPNKRIAPCHVSDVVVAVFCQSARNGAIVPILFTMDAPEIRVRMWPYRQGKTGPNASLRNMHKYFNSGAMP